MIRVICVGKLKESYFRDAVLEYQKRLQKYGHFELIEVMDEGIDDSRVALKKEASRIEKWIHPKDFLITLEIEGKMFSSVEFSSFLSTVTMNHANITFIIGGSFGLDDSIRNRANMKLSFSEMTFPHQLFRVMLLEQIYRAYKIMGNEKYHK